MVGHGVVVLTCTLGAASAGSAASISAASTAPAAAARLVNVFGFIISPC
mgnify:CR=1 FL=1